MFFFWIFVVINQITSYWFDMCNQFLPLTLHFNLFHCHENWCLFFSFLINVFFLICHCVSVYVWRNSQFNWMFESIDFIFKKVIRIKKSSQSELWRKEFQVYDIDWLLFEKTLLTSGFLRSRNIYWTQKFAVLQKLLKFCISCWFCIWIIKKISNWNEELS